MSEIAITAESISKHYSIGRKSSGNFREDITNTFSNFFNKKVTSHKEEFWALKDINFEIRKGDAFGIIGKNGAGKSTLLKILSHITKPTTGKITIDGKIASLLEIGTGFHPELTGRENIFMNGAILGMKKVEIRKKFDEIVDFSGIEKFIDTPVKRYSSGMYVRLAFSVAAHLEPEILILDEVLAVGDSVFQKKCINKMTTANREGRTILFVSHNFSAVKSLCTRAIFLENGEKRFDGSVTDAINTYLNTSTQLAGKEINLFSIERKGFTNQLIFEKISFEDYPIPFGKPIRFRLKLHSLGNKQIFKDLDLGISISDKNDNTLIHCSNRFIHRYFEHTSDTDEYIFEIENIISPGIYYLNLFLRCEDVIEDWLGKVISIEIGDGNPYNYIDATQIQGSIFPGFNITSLKDL